MGDEFVGKDGGVGFNFYEVDCHCGDLGEYCAAKGVSEGEVDVCEGEVDVRGGGLIGGGISVWDDSGGDLREYTSRTVTRGPTSSISMLS